MPRSGARRVLAEAERVEQVTQRSLRATGIGLKPGIQAFTGNRFDAYWNRPNRRPQIRIGT
jgi:hypothetical protein